MGMLTTYGGMFESRLNIEGLKYVKSTDKYYLFQRIVFFWGGVNTLNMK